MPFSIALWSDWRLPIYAGYNLYVSKITLYPWHSSSILLLNINDIVFRLSRACWFHSLHGIAEHLTPCKQPLMSADCSPVPQWLGRLFMNTAATRHPLCYLAMARHSTTTQGSWCLIVSDRLLIEDFCSLVTVEVLTVFKPRHFYSLGCGSTGFWYLSNRISTLPSLDYEFCFCHTSSSLLIISSHLETNESMIWLLVVYTLVSRSYIEMSTISFSFIYSQKDERQ